MAPTIKVVIPNGAIANIMQSIGPARRLADELHRHPFAILADDGKAEVGLHIFHIKQFDTFAQFATLPSLRWRTQGILSGIKGGKSSGIPVQPSVFSLLLSSVRSLNLC